MNKKLIAYYLFLILLISGFINNLGIVNALNEPKLAKEYTNTEELIFKQTWTNIESKVQKPTPPDVWDVINNITLFSNPNDTVYLGDDIIPISLMGGIHWTHMEINLTAIFVWDDHDPLDAGEIYVRWIPNYWIGLPEYDINNNWQNYQSIDDLTIDHDLYVESSHYSISSASPSWYNFTQPITLFNDSTILNNMLIEVFDYDPTSADESLGGVYWNYINPTDLEGYWIINLEDADIAITVTLYGTDNTFTAKNLTELYQPFLCDNDDTIHTADPNGLFARVIHGYDSSIGRNAFCIQYLYFWNEVWLDGFWTDQLIHYNDYELVQVYLNFSYTGGPVAYRFVFDNHDYYTNSTTEWRDSMEYAIYEWDTIETGILTKEISNSIELQTLLGERYTANYEYKNLDIYTSSLCGCYGGVISMMLTIETYNHQFAVGNTGGDILGQYEIAPFTDSIIYNCYGLLNLSFTQGVHEINNEIIPKYAPFAYDILNVFEVPYIHSNYADLMQQAAQFQGNIQSGGGFINVDKNITVTIDIPIQTTVDLPDILTPEDSLITILESLLDTSSTILTIEYFFNITADYDLWFIHYNFHTIIQNKIVIDFSNPIIQLLNDFISFVDDIEYSISLLSGMLTIESNFTPQLLGEILNCNITVHIDEILKYYYPPLGYILKFFFDDIYFKINPVISGYIDSDVYLGDSIQTLHWDTTTKNFNLDLDIPDTSYGSSLSLTLDNFRYGLNFQVGWIIGYDTSYFISWLFGDGDEYLLGIWPDLSYDMTALNEGIILNTWEASNGLWRKENTNNLGSNIPFGNIIVISGLFISNTIYIAYKKRRKCKIK